MQGSALQQLLQSFHIPFRSQPLSCSEQVSFVLVFEETFGGKKFDKEYVGNEVTEWFRVQVAEFYKIWIQKFIPRLNKFFDNYGDYY